jgi:hypothetical protein
MARMPFRRFVFPLVLVATLSSGAAGQILYYFPPLQTWPPTGLGFHPAPLPPVFWPYQLAPYAPYFGSWPVVPIPPDYLPYPYGNDLTQPGYPSYDYPSYNYPYYDYPYYGPFSYQYPYPYYSPYYSPPGPYQWRWHGRDSGQWRPREQPGPTEVRPRNDMRARMPQEPVLNPGFPGDRARNLQRPLFNRGLQSRRPPNPQGLIPNRGPQGGRVANPQGLIVNQGPSGGRAASPAPK